MTASAQNRISFCGLNLDVKLEFYQLESRCSQITISTQTRREYETLLMTFRLVNLSSGKYWSFRKPNSAPLYIYARSIHPSALINIS